ncbi:MAG TPA: ATP-binding protein [Candidatus Absconditabacterales bacterium]|nr:ATP-binding protein [Candidatus Absconditabacterales bacterium]HNG96667.1 ATP-binding protein [Candidatus Absconditabacterales bacterium]
MEQQIVIQNPHRSGKSIISDGYKVRKKYLNILIEEINSKKATILTGLRRIGKTTLMKQVIDYLIKEKKVSPTRILYYSCDIFGGIDSLSLLEIIQTFRTGNNIALSEKIYCFIDEVTYLENFHTQLKNIVDISALHDHTIKLFVTSSSSSIVNDQKAMLTGRHRTLLIEPLDYYEYCEFTDKGNYHDGEYFDEYLSYGGIPEYVLTKNPEVLSTIINDIINKDIIIQHAIRDRRTVFELLLLLLERVGKELSITKISHILSISKQTAQKRVNYFHETYLFNFIGRFGTLNETIRNAKKIYAIDTGIITIYRGISNKGSLYENSIYNLIKHYEPYYYYHIGNEIDFIIGKRGNYILIECKYHSKINTGQKKIMDGFNGTTYIVDGFKGYEQCYKEILSTKELLP